MSCREDKLRELRENTPTIFAPNCWGGITYHHLGLEFCSPLINMHEPEEDYLRFLSDPEHYISQDIKLREMYSDNEHKEPFPVAMMGDIELWMNHYNDFDKAKEAWDRRKARIKWDNLFVMFFTEDPERVDRFLSLPYKKKVCFVPWRTDKEGCLPVPYREQEKLQRYPFWEIINNLALGDFVLYDDVELLYDCRYVKIGNIVKEIVRQ